LKVLLRSDLATVLGLYSINCATSRALNDKGDISPEMKRRVQEVAQLMEYKPNTVARSLRKSTFNKLIGLIIPQVDHYFYSTIVKGIINSAIMDDYLIITGESNHLPNKEREIIDNYTDHHVSGVIFIPSRDQASEANVRELQRRNIHVILVDRTFPDFNGSHIRYDDQYGGHLATTHLIEQGHTNIAIFRGDEKCSISNARYAGYLQALEEHNLSPDPSHVRICPTASKNEAYDECRELWTMKSPPTAVFTITDHLAAGIYAFAKHQQLDIPQDIAIVGYSNSEVSDILDPKLTSIAQDGLELGERAKSALQATMKDAKHREQVTMSTRIIVRESSVLHV
ncbi:MAG: LacI family DNA-binding transcriptional regulator, partial [Bacteroidota bacterium]